MQIISTKTDIKLTAEEKGTLNAAKAILEEICEAASSKSQDVHAEATGWHGCYSEDDIQDCADMLGLFFNGSMWLDD